MLTKIGERPLDANVELRNLRDNVYMLEHEYNPLSCLSEGSRIWVERENHYDVYELTEAWDRDEATREAFIDAICREANP